MKKISIKTILITTALLLASAINAIAAPLPVTFKATPTNSHIKFIATQGGASIEGEFKNFTAAIKFHPEALEASKVNASIDTGSFIVNDKDAEGALGGAEWLGIEAFPKAVFESTSFKSLGNKKYEVTGNLTIKDQTQLVTIAFTLDEFNTEKSTVTGQTKLKRLSFNVGEKNTDSIKDEVSIYIDLKATADK